MNTSSTPQQKAAGKRRRRDGLRLAVAMLMVFALLHLMAYSLIGETAHEVFGLFLMVVVLVHQYLNRAWYKALGKGRYGATRLLTTAVDLLLIAAVLLQMVSGILVSKHLFPFFAQLVSQAALHLIHLAAPYWLFCLAGVHLGFHGKRVLRALGASRLGRMGRWLLRAALAAFSLYGIYAFGERKFFAYMTLENQFVFFDFREPALQFTLDYLAVLILFAVLGYLLQVGMMKKPASD